MVGLATHKEANGQTGDECRSLGDLLAPTDSDGSVLLRGPALSGKRRLAVELLSGTEATGGCPVYVSTTDPAPQVRDAAVSGSMEDLAVVDCMPTEVPSEEGRTYSVSSPGDLTGIAMAVSSAYEDFHPDRHEGSRVLVDNVSALLMYAEVKPVYRFLHALTNRVESAGGVVVATLDTDSIDTQDGQALGQLFDTHVEVRTAETGGTEFRVRGEESVPSTWFRHTGEVES